MQIYIIVNKINKNYYIGITNGNKKHYFGSGKALKDSIKKYGKKNFRKFTIEKVNNRKEASIKEKYWIKFAKNKWKFRKCLNLTDGGENEFVRNKEVQDKINLSLKEYYRNHPELKEKLKNHAINTLVKYQKINGVWNKGTAKYHPRENGNKGVNNRAAKLSEPQVIEIRRLYFEKINNQSELAIIYNVKASLISRIINRKIWKHI